MTESHFNSNQADWPGIAQGAGNPTFQNAAGDINPRQQFIDQNITENRIFVPTSGQKSGAADVKAIAARQDRDQNQGQRGNGINGLFNRASQMVGQVMSMSKISRYSGQDSIRKNGSLSLMEKSGALKPKNQGMSNDQVLGHMGSGPQRSDNLAGIKPKRRWRRPGEQFSAQGGQNDDKRGESRYVYTVFAEKRGNEKLRRLKTLIVKSLINLLKKSR
ncbi:MAG: hypothetical protein PVJ84_08665 [Desulfobacteraceae bacterium]